MYGDGKQRIAGLVMAKLYLSTSSFVLLLPLLYVGSQAAVTFSLNGCRERTDPELIYGLSIIAVCANTETRDVNYHKQAVPHCPIAEVKLAICPEGLGEKVSYQRP